MQFGAILCAYINSFNDSCSVCFVLYNMFNKVLLFELNEPLKDLAIFMFKSIDRSFSGDYNNSLDIKLSKVILFFVLFFFCKG